MKIDLTGVPSEPQSAWIKPEKSEDGSFKKIKYTLKVVSIEADGYNDDGDERYKMTFKDAQSQMISDSFTVAPEGKTTWKLKRIAIAMKAPDKLDLNDLVNRYIIAIVGGYTGKNGKDYAQIDSVEYSPNNDKLPPIPEAKSEEEVIAEEAELAF